MEIRRLTTLESVATDRCSVVGVKAVDIPHVEPEGKDNSSWWYTGVLGRAVFVPVGCLAVPTWLFAPVWVPQGAVETGVCAGPGRIVVKITPWTFLFIVSAHSLHLLASMLTGCRFMLI